MQLSPSVAHIAVLHCCFAQAPLAPRVCTKHSIRKFTVVMNTLQKRPEPWLNISFPPHMCLRPGTTPLPLSSLQLLFSPVRLVSGAIWHTVQQNAVSDYGMLEEFVSMVTDTVPGLLTSEQKTQLLMGLRAEVRKNIHTYIHTHACIHTYIHTYM